MDLEIKSQGTGRKLKGKFRRDVKQKTKGDIVIKGVR
jgi:hypothetical protein